MGLEDKIINYLMKPVPRWYFWDPRSGFLGGPMTAAIIYSF